jgi:hypothetical protein
MIYWGPRMLLFAVPRLSVGDALEVRTSMKGFLIAYLEDVATAAGDERYVPPMRGHFYDVVTFDDARPVRLRHDTVRTPRDKPIRYEVYNGEVRSALDLDGDHLVYRFWKEKLPASRPEPRSVAASDVQTKVVLATVPDWPAKSRWFATGAAAVAAEIPAFVREAPAAGGLAPALGGAKVKELIVAEQSPGLLSFRAKLEEGRLTAGPDGRVRIALPRVPGAVTGDGLQLFRQRRSRALRVPAPAREIVVSFTVPAGWEVEHLPQDAGVAAKAGTLRRTVVRDGRKVTLTTALELRERTVAPGDYAELRALFAALEALPGRTIVLRKGGS